MTDYFSTLKSFPSLTFGIFLRTRRSPRDSQARVLLPAVLPKLSFKAIVPPATVRATHRRRKTMSRRSGQDGSVDVRRGMWRGRYLVDVPGKFERVKRAVLLGSVREMTRSEARRKLREIIA